MIDCREQIRSALMTITENVKFTRPEGPVTFPLITYSEITNVNVSMRQDRIEYQIDGCASSFEEVVAIMKQIDSVMNQLGWRRSYITPDSQTRQEKDFYMKSANYVARVNTLFNTITSKY